MAISSDSFAFVKDLIRRRSAIVLECGKEYLVESRLSPLAKTRGYPSIDMMICTLKRAPDASVERDIIEAMTTNETSWFRDKMPFDALAQVVLPEVAAKKRDDRQIRIWCAACSSGQEPYTIAMTVLERLPQLRDWQISILGTDISREMVTRSREGKYGQIEMNRGLPAPLLVKYFEKQGLSWKIKHEVARLCEFRELNLIENWGLLPRMDVIFIRNVLIYFDVETKKKILTGMTRVLQPWGYLFLGGAETTLNLDVGLERVQLDRAGCYRLATK